MGVQNNICKLKKSRNSLKTYLVQCKIQITYLITASPANNSCRKIFCSIFYSSTHLEISHLYYNEFKSFERMFWSKKL